MESVTAAVKMQIDRRGVLKGAFGLGAAAIAGGLMAKTAGATSGPAMFRTTSALNLRKNASTQAQVLLVMPKGAILGNLGQSSNGFTKVRYHGQTGWASNSFIDSALGPAGGDPFEETDDAKTRTAANLRTLPSTSDDIIKVVAQGKTVKLTNWLEGDFRYIFVDGNPGWLFNDYLEAQTEGTSFKTTANVNLRSQASTNASVIKVVPKGAVVTDYDLILANGFRGVDYKGTTGWIFDDLLVEL